MIEFSLIAIIIFKKLYKKSQESPNSTYTTVEDSIILNVIITSNLYML